MITKLNNFTLKSFVGYTNPNDLLFRVKNILFGYNGKGKSAIAIGIKDEFLKDTSKSKHPSKYPLIYSKLPLTFVFSS